MQVKMQVRFKRLTLTARLPTRATPGSVGLDLYADYRQPGLGEALRPGERTVVPTGLAIAIPEGYVGLVFPRSGLARNYGVTLTNGVGVGDPDYRGSWDVLLTNLGKEICVITHGDRIAQLVIAPIVMAEPMDVDALDETERGELGFGSTGR